MTDEADTPGFDLGDTPDAPYIVLARKYRPESFPDLIGQEAMVQTLRNAFATNRIAQGFMLTGVRGVGKTTTARILARALNYEKVDGSQIAPTVDFDGDGVHCREIIKSNHPDVLEMDAASNTGVDNIREIIESARYKPLIARYKVFIIDEVHMLSKGAFNALLKTLEEPPEHVKFIFATTEVRKVPVTVLSRCQRFDLRRVDVDVLVPHFEKIVTAEGAAAETEALALIARAAEGSVRDGLSILDQAIAMGAGNVTADAVRNMIGLADRGRVFDLFEAVLSGKADATLDGFEALYRDGADPLQLLADLADVVHAVTKAKAVGVDALGDDFSGSEKERAAELGTPASMAILARAWQMLVAGEREARQAPNAKAAAEMVLIRLVYTADLPTPDQVLRAMGGATGAASAGSAATSAPAGDAPASGTTARRTSQGPRAVMETAQAARGMAVAAAGQSAPSAERQMVPQPAAADRSQQLSSFDAVIDFVGNQRDAKLKLHLEDHVSLVAFEPGRIEVSLLQGAPQKLAGELGEKLTKWTGARWIVTVSSKSGAEPVGEVRRRTDAEKLEKLKQHPAVRAVLEALPEVRIAEVRDIDVGAAALGSEAVSEMSDLADDNAGEIGTERGDAERGIPSGDGASKSD
ncbi:MAG: DNA polymerase III subunit gamma/tau [Pseudomonadota bacterium]